MILALIAPLALIITQADVRARVAAQQEADQQAIESLTFPGFDASDESVKASAEHYCGRTAQCSASFLEARTTFIRHAALERREKKALRLLQESAEPPYTDWRLANTRYEARFNPPAPPPSIGVTTTCRTYSGRGSIYTRCSTY